MYLWDCQLKPPLYHIWFNIYARGLFSRNKKSHRPHPLKNHGNTVLDREETEQHIVRQRIDMTSEIQWSDAKLQVKTLLSLAKN